ncbi:hypothetical protein LZ30DRAFT_66167 [Colletotrichum cereale]|nr:hypothetical protein LZ30DRAFT_66167 [Colletotrichum cereale]
MPLASHGWPAASFTSYVGRGLARLGHHPTFERRRWRWIPASLKHRSTGRSFLALPLCHQAGYVHRHNTPLATNQLFRGDSTPSGQLANRSPSRSWAGSCQISDGRPLSSAFDTLQLLLLLLRMMSVPSGGWAQLALPPPHSHVCLLDPSSNGAEQTGAGARNWDVLDG